MSSYFIFIVLQISGQSLGREEFLAKASEVTFQWTFLVLFEMTESSSSRFSVLDMKPWKHTLEFIAMEKDK